MGPDGLVYVANNSTNGGPDEVLQINPSNDTLTGAPFVAKGIGTTALASGSYNGASGVFVGSTDYNGGGSLDFINTTAPTITKLESMDVYRILVLSANQLVTTGDSSYVINGLSTGSLSTPIQLGSGPSGADLAYKDGLIYVGYTDFSTSKLYVFDTSGTARVGTAPCP